MRRSCSNGSGSNDIRGSWTLIAAAPLLGLVIAVVRPVLVIPTLPITILTLGLFLVVINAAMLILVVSLFQNFNIDGFWSAMLGALVISITGWLTSWFIGSRGRVEVTVQRSR